MVPAQKQVDLKPTKTVWVAHVGRYQTKEGAKRMHAKSHKMHTIPIRQVTFTLYICNIVQVSIKLL